MGTVKNTINLLSQLAKNEPAAFSLLKPGDLVEGSVLDKSVNMILVDLGKHGTGAVYRGEIQNARNIVRQLEPGGKVHAKVVAVDNEDGYVELSLAEAGKQKAWTEVVELAERGDPITVTISGFNRGGLTADICGLQAFMPISQLAGEHYPRMGQDGDRDGIIKEIQKLVGGELTVKIIDANHRTGKLILSEREAAEVSSRELAKNYVVGQVIEGIISGVADFGAFVRFTDNPGLEGMVHVSELSHRMVENPKEVVHVDDAVKAQIVEIKDGKISLSLKVLQADPWEQVAARYGEGQETVGTVYSYTPFGAIVNLEGQLQGQVHVTAFGSVEEMRRQLPLGRELRFVVAQVRPLEKRIALKLIT